METVSLETEDYAVTWSPKMVTVHYNSQIRRDVRTYFSVMDSSGFNNIYVYPEININGNLHYHMLVEVFDKVKFYKAVIPSMKRDGYVIIKRVFDRQKWFDYMTKEVNVMSQLIKYPVPITRGFIQELKQLDIKRELIRKKRIESIDQLHRL